MIRHPLIRRFVLAIGIVSVTTVVVLVAFHFYRVRLCDRIDRRIDSLALYPPSDTTDLEWAVHVYWTHNLHGNSMPLAYASTDSLWHLDDELDDALNSRPTRKTIDDLWVRYSEMTSLGAEYRRKYEPEKNRIASLVAEQGLGYRFIDDYLSFSSREP
ncbi:hypothetical protein [Allorhodopirellula solitaria]|uniref:Uncharacterized protein n=1 Tax=Allorhodopirellula solitaria TaxID=2527987 RepID=A0A5C5XS77_9BACT|nr:hypothetical protein [Allorhodopirellula solitaria]TWT66057.1 hypothetical protein CA85_29190 [Allorhodopirellula solitaria]